MDPIKSFEQSKMDKIVMDELGNTFFEGSFDLNGTTHNIRKNTALPQHLVPVALDTALRSIMRGENENVQSNP